METPETQQDAPGAHTADGGGSEAPARACPACGGAMAPEQDWCLECGTAAPGRLGVRPGWRAAATIVGAVLLLVGGAVAASYAALNDSAQHRAAAPAPPSAAPQVAQAPTTPATPPTTATPPPTQSTPTPPPAPTPPPKPTPAPKKATPPPAKPAPTPAKVVPKPKPKPKTPSVKPGLQALKLGPDAALVYDPYKRATDQSNPDDSYDADDSTVFSVTTAPTSEMGVGLDFDLTKPSEVSAVYIRTTTPGFRVEIYGAKGKLPPDILDTRWKHLGSATSVGAKNKGLEKITFTPGHYRQIVLWFTTPPPAGPTVGIAETRILD